jgi:hypothetical protein
MMQREFAVHNCACLSRRSANIADPQDSAESKVIRSVSAERSKAGTEVALFEHRNAAVTPIDAKKGNRT